MEMKGCKDCENYEKQIRNLQIKVRRKYYSGIPKEVQKEIDYLKKQVETLKNLLLVNNDSCYGCDRENCGICEYCNMYKGLEK